MSLIKNKKFYILVIFAIFSFFMFGCEEKIPVNNISFEDKQIVMVVGEEIAPKIVFNPTNPTNKGYKLQSADTGIVKVEGKNIIAQKVGSTYVKVVSDDNNSIENVISIKVNAQKTILEAPKNLTYNPQTQIISFDGVSYASSYILSIDDNAINIGNSNQYNLNDYENLGYVGFDKVLNIKVKAVAPSYSQAFSDSNFSAVKKIYQQKSINLPSVRAGKLNFSSNAVKFDILINGNFVEQVSNNQYDLTNLNQSYANQTIDLGIIAKPNASTMQGVEYFDSKITTLKVKVVGEINFSLINTTLSWQNLSNVQNYDIKIDNQTVATTSNNYFDLSSLQNYNQYVNSINGYNLSVEPKIKQDNLAKIESLNFVKLNRIATPILNAQNNIITWSATNANQYKIILEYGQIRYETVTNETSFSLNNYPSNNTYTFKVIATQTNDGNFSYLPSIESLIQVEKQSEVPLTIENYQLNFNTTINDKYKILLDEQVLTTITATGENYSFNLNDNYTAGEHKLQVVHLGNNQAKFDSNASEITFVQLQKINQFAINNSKVDAEIGNINANDNIIYKIFQNESLVCQCQGKEFNFNSTQPNNENFLSAGDYIVKLFVVGDGSATFSYRQDGELVSNCQQEITVLQKPSLSLLDTNTQTLTISNITNASGYSIYLDSQKLEDINVNEYEFSINQNETKSFNAQALGNGTNIINSALSETLTISRLKTPTLVFDNTTNKLAIQYQQIGAEQNYILTKVESELEQVVNYDFENPTAITDFNCKYKVYVKSNGLYNGVYYLNSLPSEIDINKISNTCEIAIDINNNLVISTENVQEYDLELIFDDGDNQITLTTNENKLSNNEFELIYNYDNGTYTIPLLNSDFSNKLNINKSFAVKVKFIGLNNTANSDYSETFNVSYESAVVILRNNQNLEFTISENKSYLDYSLLINNETIMQLISEYQQENKVVIPAKDIYDAGFTGQLSIKIISKNSNESVLSNNKLSSVSAEMLIDTAQSLTLTQTKQNNSTIVSFEEIITDYAKNYVIEISNDEQTITETNKTSINLDDYTLIGTISVKAYITTFAYTTVDDKTVYLFNSIYSNALNFEKLATVSQVDVSNSIVSFAPIRNAYGYIVYKVVAENYTPLHEGVLTSNQIDLSNQTENITIAVKTISNQDGFTNSNMGESILLTKMSMPVVEIEKGDFVINLDYNKIINASLKGNLSLEITNNETTQNVILNEFLSGIEFSIGKKEIVYPNSDLVKLAYEIGGVITAKIIIEPEFILSYTSSLSQENVQFKYSFESENYSTYLDSQNFEMSVIGINTATNITDFTSGNSEQIQFTESGNVYNSQDVSAGYMFKITNKSKTYYSTDSKLKFKTIQTNLEQFNSYPLLIEEINFLFPVGYDKNNDGNISAEEMFVAGDYEIEIKVISKDITGYNFVASKYSDGFTVTILDKVKLSTTDGQIEWATQENATKYLINIYEKDAITIKNQIYSTEPSFDFESHGLNYVGIFGITVQAVGENVGVINGVVSDMIMVYRMPEVSEILIDDGNLVILANKYFSYAKLKFTNISNLSENEITFRNADITNNLTSLNLTNWKNYSSDISNLNESERYIVNIDEKTILNLTEGGSFHISVKLYGNTENNLPVISSATLNYLNNMQANKLEKVETNVYYGNLEFGSATTYTNLNYNFNNQTTISDFWQNTLVYNIKIATSQGNHEIYALDYDSFNSAVNNGDLIEGTDFEYVNDVDNLYAYVIYNSTVGEDELTMYINVYENNEFNFNLDSINYYFIQSEINNNIINYYGETENLRTIDLTNGGSYEVSSVVLGGDGASNVGYLTSNINKENNNFMRYSKNEIIVNLGIINIKDSRYRNENNEILDKPIYIISAEKLNSTTQYFCLYYNTPEEAEEIILRNNIELDNLQYVQINKFSDDLTKCLFNISDYISAGIYNVNIRTLAGKGTNENVHYLLNSKVVLETKAISKGENTYFTINNGVLEFAKSQIVNTGVYLNDYEITVKNNENQVEVVYTINANDTNVENDVINNLIRYTLPANVQGELNNLTFNNTNQYAIKIRPLAPSTSQNIVNGSYDNQTTFTIARDVSDVAIQNGKLVWTGGGANYLITLSYGDKTIKIASNNTSYQFEDKMYNLTNGTKEYITSGVEYSVSIKSIGNSSNLLSSFGTDCISLTRLPEIDNSSIVAENGILVWETAQGATGYKIVVISEDNTRQYEYLTEQASIDLNTQTDILPAGNYKVKITALGDDIINGMTSAESIIITKLAQVTGVKIHESNSNYMTWTNVEGAQAYCATFTYNGNTYSQTVLSNTVMAPYDLSGTFTFTVQAIGTSNNILSGEVSEAFETSKDRPTAVGEIRFDNLTNRFYFTAPNILNGDKIEITYSYNEFVLVDSSVQLDTQKTATHTINYLQEGNYFVQEGITYYFFEPTIMAEYTHLSAVVVRTATLSSSTSEFDFSQYQNNVLTLRLFDYGHGTEENPYIINNAQQLLNIRLKSDKYYRLSANINLNDVKNDVISNLTNIGVIVSETFSGVLDGNNYSIYFQESERYTYMLELSNVNNFALFGNLQGKFDKLATIKNLSFGKQSISTTIKNTFANNYANVVKLGVVAIDAINSKLENINAFVKFDLIGTNISNNASISGLVVNATDCVITNCNLNIDVNVNAKAKNLYIAGMVINATDVVIGSGEELTSRITLNITKGINFSKITYLGGAVAYMENENNQSQISDLETNIIAQNIKVDYFGGVVAIALEINMSDCYSQGNYSYQGINSATVLGGLTGQSNGSTIENSGSDLTFDVTINNSTGVYIGGIIGVADEYLTELGATKKSSIKYCYLEYAFDTNTNITTLYPIEINIAGIIVSAEISNCYYSS